MNEVATMQHPSITAAMAARYQMSPQNFEATLRATVIPTSTSREEFAAFLMVAKEYGLNPLTKEIYAFPKKGGGIQPIVSLDGWTNILNSHPAFDGLEFADHIEKGQVVSITCRIYRKDRTHPIECTEYLAECHRGTEPWQKWPRRMLRHKALIQAARYAFGFAGIVDPDEAERFTITKGTTRPPLSDRLQQLAQTPKPPIDEPPDDGPLDDDPIDPIAPEDDDDQAMVGEAQRLREAVEAKAHEGVRKLHRFKARLMPAQIALLGDEEWQQLEELAALADNPPRAEQDQ